DYAAAAALFEESYSHGYDAPELHAMLAFARYRASGASRAAAQDALELLDYAEQQDPNLDLVFAYRGAILLGLGDATSARESFERALQLNPYCQLAIEYINNM
ncbi:MAG TPA: hypothetical protein PKW35_06460, partial [Nannocystaceae bacterium]|nr:hypothetical protein [Nannocystaceae bacterium]